MSTDWQTWAAGAVVVITASLFLFKAFPRKGKKGGCSTCGCSATPKVKGVPPGTLS